MVLDHKTCIVPPTEVADAHRYSIEDEGPFIKTTILGAQSLLKVAGAWKPEDPMCKTAILMIVGHWLENRDLMSYDFKSTRNLPISIQSIINALRFGVDDG